MNIKSKKMKTRNIPNNHQVIDQLTNKPYHLLVLALLMGVFIMYFNIYVGLFFVIFAIFMLLMKKRVVIAFYDDFVVFYTDRKNEECYILYLDEIKSWEILSNKKGVEIKVIFNNYHDITLQCTTKYKVLKYFKTKLADKMIKE